MRFAEYLDTWNNQRIDSNSLIVDGTHQTPNYITEGVKFVSVENIKNPYESNKFISKEDYNSYKIKPRIGDILMTRITAGIIGETYVINKTEDLGYYVSLALIRPDNKYINSNFLSYYINSPYFKHELDKRIIKVAFPRKINLNDIGECKISIPSLIEQEKIATLLNKIDRRIETQSKIINDLEAQRKYIINRLLNKLNNNKFIQLSDILEEYSERTSSNNEFPVLSSTTSGLFFQTEYFNKDASSSDTTGYRIIPKGYCTYRSMSDTGHFTFNQQNIIDIGIISPAYPVFYSKKYMNEFIILYLNNSQDIKKQILELKTGGTRFALSFKTLISFKIPKVDTLTQKKTLKIINSISEKIDNENNIYNYLIKEKSYLLNNMFI